MERTLGFLQKGIKLVFQDIQDVDSTLISKKLQPHPLRKNNNNGTSNVNWIVFEIAQTDSCSEAATGKKLRNVSNEESLS